ALLPPSLRAAPRRLFRLALPLLLSAGSPRLLDHAALLPALPPSPDPVRGIGAHGAAASVSGDPSARPLGADAALAAAVLGTVLRECNQRPARAHHARSTAARVAQLSRDAQRNRHAQAPVRLAVGAWDAPDRRSHRFRARQGRLGARDL